MVNVPVLMVCLNSAEVAFEHVEIPKGRRIIALCFIDIF